MRVRFQTEKSSPPALIVEHKPAACTSSNGSSKRAARDRPDSSTTKSSLRFGHRAVAAAVLVAVAGCATVDRMQPLAWKVEPVMDVRHGAQSSDAYYQLGRYYAGSHAWDNAIDAYHKAIAADARNVEAYNALGVALAGGHRYEEAEATLRKAVEIDPNSAHVWSNLGFVLMLAGRPHEAIGELKTALTLDPDNATARSNLREARAQWEVRRASRESDMTAAVSKLEATSVQSTGPASPVPVTSAEVPAPPSTLVRVPAPLEAAVVPVPAGLRVNDRPTVPAFPMSVVAGSGGLQAKDPDQVVPVSLVVHQAASATVSIQLELSNGNGIKGAAARLKQWLAAEGLQVDRLTNRRPYDQKQTVIQYRDGQQEAALHVARTLRMIAQLDATPSTYLRSDVRVVLGHDWVRTAPCLERNACERPAMVAAVPQR